MTPEDMTPDDFRKIADQFKQACPEFEHQGWKLEALRNLEPEEYSLIFKALAEARQAMEWRPIESAPKDGTRFDVWMHDPDRPHGYRVTDCKWCNKQKTFVNSRLFRLEAMIPVDTGIPAIYPTYFKLVTPPSGKEV